jgi:hypothetical protein
MIEAGTSPKETLIIEDSVVGRAAANSSGGKRKTHKVGLYQRIFSNPFLCIYILC